MASLLIGAFARRAGISAATVRYYERLGLLPTPPRATSGYRRYDEQAVETLRFIRNAQALGFSLAELAGIFELSRAGQPPCSRVLSLARSRLAAVDRQLEDLRAFRRRLARQLDVWEKEEDPASSCTGVCRLIARVRPGATSRRSPRVWPLRA